MYLLSSCWRCGTENHIKWIIQRSSWLAVVHRRRTWHQGVINLQPCSGLSRARLQKHVLTDVWRQEVISSARPHCDTNSFKINIKCELIGILKSTDRQRRRTLTRGDEFWPLSCSSSVAAGAPEAFPSQTGFRFSCCLGFIGLWRMCLWMLASWLQSSGPLINCELLDELLSQTDCRSVPVKGNVC